MLTAHVVYVVFECFDMCTHVQHRFGMPKYYFASGRDVLGMSLDVASMSWAPSWVN